MEQLTCRLSLYFTRPGGLEVREEPLPPLKPDQVLIKTLYSAISPGTELLVYRGQVSSQLAVDDAISSLPGVFQFPLKYGYSLVGQVIAVGSLIAPAWLGKTVFSFHPHETFFHADLSELIEIPEGIPPLDALFLPNMETAVNFVMDGQPLIGEKVLVFGQGIVGLLTVALLAQFPLRWLLTLDLFEKRRHLSQILGAYFSLDPASQQSITQIKALLRDEFSSGADLIYELSGNPLALDQAIALAGFEGRLVVGSWYGTKAVNLNLGENFHRNRLRLISSQVSAIAPVHQGRWTKSRRFQTVWQMLSRIKPSQFISHSFTLTQAAEAYRILDENPGEAVQIIFAYQQGVTCTR